MAESTALPKRAKLHGRAFYESIGSPKFIVAPMVDQSEFAWRMLVRSFLPADQRASVLAYSPMLHARLYEDTERYRTTHFEAVQPPAADSSSSSGGGAAAAVSTPYLDGNPAMDRPLFVQFCANDPAVLLAAARRVAPHCDAIDLNLGCPQGIARKGHYGAFLQEEPALVARLVRTLHESADVDVPVTAKIRVLATRAATLEYAQTVLAAGASILTVHGRQREQKGHLTGLADWSMLRFLRENLPPETVLFANGNVLQPGDVQRCLDATGFDGVMSAEGLLSDPALFGPRPEKQKEGEKQEAGEEKKEGEKKENEGEKTPPSPWWPTPDPEREYWTSQDGLRGGWRVDAIMRRYLDILRVYGLGEAAPVRQPLFVPGDEPWQEAKVELAAAAPDAGDDLLDPPSDAADEPPRKKRKRAVPRVAPTAVVPATVLYSPNFVAVQAHLFHLLRHAVARHHDIRDALARSRKGDMPAYERILATLEQRVAAALTAEAEAAAAGTLTEEARQAATDRALAAELGEDHDHPRDSPDSSAAAVRRCRRPWWVAQPVLRPMPAEALAKGAIQEKKKKKGDKEGKAE